MRGVCLQNQWKNCEVGWLNWFAIPVFSIFFKTTTAFFTLLHLFGDKAALETTLGHEANHYASWVSTGTW